MAVLDQVRAALAQLGGTPPPPAPDQLDAPDCATTQPWPGQVYGTPFMHEHGWAPLGFENFPVRYRGPEADRHTFVFTGRILDSYPGEQLKNGVGQLNVFYNCPWKGDVPYWQSTTRTNPVPVTRFGGPGVAPMGATQVFQTAAASSAGKPIVAGGPGTIAGPTLSGWAGT